MENLKIKNQVLACHTSTGQEPQVVIRGEWLATFGFPVGSELEMEILPGEILLKRKEG